MVKELSIESIKKDIIDKLLNDLDILNHFKKYTERRYNVPISKFLNLFIFDCDASNVGEDYISVEVAEYEMNRLINSDCKRYIVSIKMSLKMESDICKMATTISNIVNGLYPERTDYSNLPFKTKIVYDNRECEKLHRVITFTIIEEEKMKDE